MDEWNVSRSLTLSSPITDEQWDMLTDVDLDKTDRVWFHTKHGKDVGFVKQKTGHWLKAGTYHGELRFMCSECENDETVPTATDFTTGIAYPIWEFCPWCGAKMEMDYEDS